METVIGAFLAGIAFGWFVIAPAIAWWNAKRFLKREAAWREAAMRGPRPITPEEETAALEPEIRKGDAA
jgi:hypothetical protein